jgi:hypothetical protein
MCNELQGPGRECSLRWFIQKARSWFNGRMSVHSPDAPMRTFRPIGAATSFLRSRFDEFLFELVDPFLQRQ